MGILDDAIREHLELKRQHGAADSDVDRLEQEAFGPAARPGDPGYETGESPLPQLESDADEAPTTVAPIADGPEVEGEPAEVPAEVDDPAAPTIDPVEAPEAGIFDVEGGELDVESMNTEDFAAAAGAGNEPTPAELARAEHPHLDDTIDHPAPEPTSLSEELEQAAPSATDVPVEEPAAPAAAEPEDQEEGAGPEATPAEEEAEAESAPATPLVDPDEEEDEPPRPVDEAPEGDDEEDGDPDSDDADLLEETPEFLKEAPDGEDLWFEQGPPKDFDFD